MNFFFVTSFLLAAGAASASEVDKASGSTNHLRGIAKFKQEKLEEFQKIMNGWPGNNRSCPAMKGCSSYDYCPSSGCGPCDFDRDQCTPYNPDNRGGGGMHDACFQSQGCVHYDYCADMGCGSCQGNHCTLPADEDEKDESQDEGEVSVE